MKFFVGVTDNQWFDVVSHIPGIDEVNFWQPGGGSSFKVLAPLVSRLETRRNPYAAGVRLPRPLASLDILEIFLLLALYL